MNVKKFEELLCSGLDLLNLSIDGTELENLWKYFQELKRWSPRVNLIAKETDDEVIVEKHFIDSLALLTVVDGTDDYLLDIGSGAGFPGLVCKIARPALGVDLMEPRLKRVSFLNHIIRTCRIDGVETVSKRLDESTVLKNDSDYTCVTSRAVTDIAQFLSMCLRFRRRGTRVICMKGLRFRQELEEASGRIDGWKLTLLNEYHLPFSHSSRALLVYESLE